MLRYEYVGPREVAERLTSEPPGEVIAGAADLPAEWNFAVASEEDGR